MSNRITARIVLVCLFVSALSAAAVGAGKDGVADLIARYDAAKANYTLNVVRLHDGAVLFEHNPHSALMPASNEKIVTSAFALKRLGPNFQFRTVLGMAGDDLVVLGDGDPTSGDPVIAKDNKSTIYAMLDAWAAKLKHRGLTKIDGNLLIRTGIFQPPGICPEWERKHVGTWYGAPVAGVNFNDNCFDVMFEGKSPALTPVLRPDSRFFTVINSAKSGPKQLWHCVVNPEGSQLTITGTLAKAAADPTFVPTTNPGYLFGAALAERIIQAGIPFSGKIIVSADPADAAGPGGLQIIAEEKTPLSAAMSRANKRSLNMMAECLFLRSGVEKGAPATWKGTAELAEKTLQAAYDIPEEELVIADGSGLARENHISSSAMCKLLSGLVKEKIFVDSLAIGGTDGSLNKRFTEPRYTNRVIAKTGTINNVSSLSGYILDHTGDPVLAFSILVNGAGGAKMSPHDFQDAVCEALVRQVDGE